MIRRPGPTLLIVFAMATCLALYALACGSTSAKVSCGAGTVLEGSTCVVASADAGAAIDDGAAEATTEGGDSAPPPRPPSFGGIVALAPVSATALLAVWQPGVDTSDPTAPLGYRVYVAQHGQPLDYATPTVGTGPGAVSVVVGGLSAGVSYDVGVRAVNAAGLEDANTKVVSASPAPDTTAPTFVGLDSAAPGGSGAVALTWPPATDVATPPEAMTYLVFMSSVAGGEDFSSPVAVSAPGATSITVRRLASGAGLRYFVVLARDAAGNVSATGSAKELSAAPGPDTVPPQFGGCVGAANVSAVDVAVAWQPAIDDVSLPTNIKYEVLASTTPGVLASFTSLATATGQTQVVIPDLQPSTRYYFICRAIDEAGNADDNASEVTVTTGGNAVPPVFVTGVTLKYGPAPFTATIAWDTAATDAVTPQNEIEYDVFVSTAPGAEVTSGIPQWSTTQGGLMSLLLTNLTPNATLYFVVCARDSEGNHACAASADGGSDEVFVATPVSFAQNIEPLFAHDCGVVGCHVPGNPTGRLVLAKGFAYGAIVNVPAFESQPVITLKPDAGLPPGMTTPITYPDGGGAGTIALNYVTPSDAADSFLYIKTHIDALNGLLGVAASTPILGQVMPAPATGTTLEARELDSIRDWINQGAPNN